MSRLLAILGGTPMFQAPIPVGQLYFPSWDRYELAFGKIFERKYYTNHGPLLQELEEALESYLGVKHVICVTNATIGLMMAAEALELTGKVIVPSFTFIASIQSLAWSNIEPVYCDVDPKTHQINADHVADLISDEVSGIMAVNLWGGACSITTLQALADEHNLKLFFDSAHAFGCKTDIGSIGQFGMLEVFSFHATKILSAAEGGCVCTNDESIAARLRNIRSSYGAGVQVDVVKTSNGRMSEAQAALALMSLEDFPVNRDNNEKLFRAYKTLLDQIPGLNIMSPSGVTRSNYQYLVCEVDEHIFGLSRDNLIAILEAENVQARRYFYPGAHKIMESSTTLPVTDHLCKVCIQLPVGSQVSFDDVKGICEVIAQSWTYSEDIKMRLRVNAV